MIVVKRPDIDAIEARRARAASPWREDIADLSAYARTLEDERDGLLAVLQRAAHEHTDLRAALAAWEDCETPDAADNDGVPGPARRLTREDGYDVDRDEHGEVCW